MKIVAGVLGILNAFICFNIATIGGAIIALGGGMQGTGVLGPLLVYGIPIGNLVGGCLAFAKPRAGGILLLVCAVVTLLWLGVHEITVLPLALGGLGGLFGLMAGPSPQEQAPPSRSHPAPAFGGTHPAQAPATTHASTPALPSGPAESLPSGAATRTSPPAATYDVARWKALLAYDSDVARAAARIQPLGQAAEDELARAYLALGDKSYLDRIVERIVADPDQWKRAAVTQAAGRRAELYQGSIEDLVGELGRYGYSIKKQDNHYTISSPGDRVQRFAYHRSDFILLLEKEWSREDGIKAKAG